MDTKGGLLAGVIAALGLSACDDGTVITHLDAMQIADLDVRALRDAAHRHARQQT